MKSAALYLSPVMIRRPTDKFFILLLPINVLLWLTIGIYEMYVNNESSKPMRKEKISNKLSQDYRMNFNLLRSLSNVTIYATVSAIVIVSFLFITRALKAKSIVFTAMSLIVITIVIFIMFIPWEMILLISGTLGSQSFLLTLTAIILTFLYLIYQVTIFVCVKETNVNLTAELMCKSCAAILHSFEAVFVSLALGFLSIIILMITINVSLAKIFAPNYLNYDLTRNQDRQPSYLDLLPVSVFFIAGIHIFNFVWNFGFTIMANYSANFYARSNSEKNSNVNIFQSIERIARYHLGTIAFLSTPILPSICALVMAFKADEKYSTSYKSIDFFSKISLIFDVSDYALVNTSIYGYKSLKSLTEMFDLHQRSSLLFLTLNAISTKIVSIYIVLATILGMIMRIFILPLHHDLPFHRLSQGASDDMMFYEVFVAAIYVNFMCKSLTRSAMCTLSIYKMTSLQYPESFEDRIAITEQSIQNRRV